ncbi:MAG TPA: PAS domain S-box protein [Syntrophales bacterium]|nr:PAS domain S-box protein [Syntrophales bacterium]
MDKMHSLLNRQLKRHLGGMESIPEEWKSFIDAVNEAYRQIDTDREMLERSLDLSSQELLQANSEMRAVLKAFPDLLFRTDREGIVLHYQTSNSKDLHFLQGEVVGRRISNVFPEAMGKKFDEALNRVQGTRSLVNIEYSVVKQDSEHFYEARLLPLLESQIIIIIRDITERKRAEEAVWLRERYFRWITESMKDLLFHIDKKGVIKYRLPAYGGILGYSENEVLGKSAFNFIHPDDYDVALHAFQELMSKGQSRIEIRLRHSSGQYVWMELVGNVLSGDDESMSGAVVVCRDITDRQHMEEKLRKSEEKYRTILETIDDGYFESDLSGNLTFFNPATCRVLGYPPDELTGMNYRKFVDEATAGKVKQVYEHVYKTGNAMKSFEYEVIRKDGTKVFIETSVSLMKDVYDQPIGFRSVGRDITESKKLEAQFIQAQKMEAIGTLAGGIAHDFNNLMMGIQGHASLMLSNMGPDHPHYEKLRSIEDQVKSAAELTRQLLGFARRGKYEVKPTNLNDILEKTSTMFGRTRREIIIHRKTQEDLWTVEVDRGQIEQVLLNIYVNAWQAMPGGGDLFLETKNIIVDERYEQLYYVKPGKYVKVSITDTGMGMDEKTRQRIFEPFFTTKEMGRGTGLGLASAYGIIKGHGGFINVYSEKGHGTIFGIYLPASEKEVSAKKLPAKEVLKGYETILLVDDEEMVINVSREILALLGYRVIVAKSGREAIEIYKARHEEIDLVILDMIMPGIGGSETFDVLKEINPQIKVLLSSGYSVNGRPAKMLDRGCQAFIQKPFSMGDLSQKIREVLDMRTDFPVK